MLLSKKRYKPGLQTLARQSPARFCFGDPLFVTRDA